MVPVSLMYNRPVVFEYRKSNYSYLALYVSSFIFCIFFCNASSSRIVSQCDKYCHLFTYAKSGFSLFFSVLFYIHVQRLKKQKLSTFLFVQEREKENEKERLTAQLQAVSFPYTEMAIISACRQAHILPESTQPSKNQDNSAILKTITSTLILISIVNSN